MKSRASEWVRARTAGAGKSEVKKTALGLIKDVIDIEELSIIISAINDMILEEPERKGSFYILDIVMAYKQKGIILREDDIIEYYLTATKEGYSIADDIISINQIDKNRYLHDINRIIERFEYANPANRELTLW